jgi:hypothetical protein
VLSKDRLEIELSVVYTNDTFSTEKSIYAACILVKGNNLESKHPLKSA